MKVVEIPKKPRNEEIDDIIDDLIADHDQNNLDGVLVVTFKRDLDNEELNFYSNNLPYTTKLGMLAYAKEDILDIYRILRDD